MNVIKSCVFFAVMVVVLASPIGSTNVEDKATIARLYPEGLKQDSDGMYLRCYSYHRSGTSKTTKCRVRSTSTTQRWPVCRKVMQNNDLYQQDCTHQQTWSIDEYDATCSFPDMTATVKICHCLGNLCNGNSK